MVVVRLNKICQTTELSTTEVPYFIKSYSKSKGLRRKAQKRGLNFTLMVAGSSGSGKTTFVNTLSEESVFPPRSIPDADKADADKTVEITPYTVGTCSLPSFYK
jgi:septin family protein